MESSPTHRARQAGCTTGSAQAGCTPSRDALPHHARELAGVRPLPQDVARDVAPVHIIMRTREVEATGVGSMLRVHGWVPTADLRTEADAEIYLSERRAERRIY